MKIKLLLIFLCFSYFALSQVQVLNLLVEGQSSPIGIATIQPRFSWQLNSEKRNVKQIAYQILVATSKLNLEKNMGDVWSSGKIDSEETVNILFGSNNLKPNQYYYVKVWVKTNNGDETWSKPAFFTIGFLNTFEWKAKWIGYDKAFSWDSVSQWSRLSARYFRKEFNTQKTIKKAFVNLVGLGMYELHINGRKIGNKVLTPAPTDYLKTVLSNTYDVTEHIKKGKNAIGVILGNGRFFTMRQDYKPQKINNFGYPKLLFQLDIIYTDGSMRTVISDQSWKFTADGPIRTNNEYDGEEYDATKELENWSIINFNDSKWLTPQLVKAPEGKITPQPNPAMKVMKIINPNSIKNIKEGTYILDMGQNFAGWLQINVKGKKGDKVNLRFAESLQPDGELYVANLRDARVTDVYTLNGKGEEVWHPVFVYHGFRYVEITGWPGVPELENFEGHLVFDQMQTIGSLKTSDETINQILKNAWWGIASNYKGMPVDCPQRNERQPWLGDRAQGAYGESFLFNNVSIYAKWLDDIEQSQTEVGVIPDVAPAFWNYYTDNITWPGTYILVAQMLYHQFNDKQSIFKHYSSMKKWMMYMKSKYLENNILTKDKYGDWCVPPEDLKMIRSQDSMRNTNGQLIATAYYYHLLGIMSDFARVSKNDKDIGVYSNLRENIKLAFNKRFFNKETNQYDNGTVTANLLPYCFGMISEENRTIVLENILKKLNADNMHISTGVIGTQWLMRTLTHNGKSDAAFTLASNTTYPSWGYMIKNGATTIWELWNGNTADPKMNSQNHIMLLGDLLIWMFEDIGGIKSLKPGFKEIEMKPAFESGLKYADASYQSVHGEIKSNWSLKNGKLSWKITVPANTSAVIYIPEEDYKLIKEGGRAILEAEGISLLTKQKGMTSLRLNSGTYFIETLK